MNENTEKKAIEELAQVLDKAKEDALATIGSLNRGWGTWYAEAVHNAGYRKQSVGEWKWIADDSPMCNICGNVFDTDDNADAGTGLWKFCPNCGARMKGGAERWT